MATYYDKVKSFVDNFYVMFARPIIVPRTEVVNGII